MRPGAVRIESVGSIWFLDEAGGEYLRLPKTEGPRESPEGEDWGGPDAGGLEDLKWHPMFGWERKVYGMTEKLVIFTDEAHEMCVSAPLGIADLDKIDWSLYEHLLNPAAQL